MDFNQQNQHYWQTPQPPPQPPTPVQRLEHVERVMFQKVIPELEENVKLRQQFRTGVKWVAGIIALLFTTITGTVVTKIVEAAL